MHLLNNRRNKELVNICERRPLSIFNEIVSVVESSTIAHHTRDPHKQYLWDVRTGVVGWWAVDDVPLRTTGTTRVDWIFPNQAGMKRSCSQSLIKQQDEKKTKSTDILRFTEHRNPTDVHNQWPDGPDFILIDKKRSDAASGLSPGASTSSSTSMESTEKPLEDSGVKSEFPSPEVVTSRSVDAPTVPTDNCTPAWLFTSTELMDKCRRILAGLPSTSPIDHSDESTDSHSTLSPIELVRPTIEVSDPRSVPAQPPASQRPGRYFHRDWRYGPSSAIQTAYASTSTAYRDNHWYLTARSLAVLGRAVLA